MTLPPLISKDYRHTQLLIGSSIQRIDHHGIYTGHAATAGRKWRKFASLGLIFLKHRGNPVLSGRRRLTSLLPNCPRNSPPIAAVPRKQLWRRC